LKDPSYILQDFFRAALVLQFLDKVLKDILGALIRHKFSMTFLLLCFFMFRISADLSLTRADQCWSKFTDRSYQRLV
jgi:hypothetical protein